jgi:formylglycine-generating enzyme required for sulfatase activity
MAFCDWLGRNEGRTYRLPTWKEWQWAADAGSARHLDFGSEAEGLEDHVWHKGNSQGRAHPVGEKKPNPWGLFDTYGNVWELAYNWPRQGQWLDLATTSKGPTEADRVYFQGGSYWDAPPRPEEVGFCPPSHSYSHFGFRVILVGDLKGAGGTGR